MTSAGTTGFLTAYTDDAGNPSQAWRTFADNSMLPIYTGSMGHDSHSDMVVTSNGGSSVQIRDMKAGSGWFTSFEIASEFKPGSQLVGVVGDILYVSVPSGTENYRELWKLQKVNGVSQKSKLSSRTRNVDYKVVASDGSRAIVLGTEMVRAATGGYEPAWWTATTSALSNSVLDWEGSSGTREWYPTSTGALTATHRAVVIKAQSEGTPRSPWTPAPCASR
ncbi:hypothetical protein O1L60_22330 [Streptomyces diastatochromogenes]|nr:hypothetical protein [Streptomyces diastatochromogenes]